MKILLSIASHDSKREEYSKMVELPSLPVAGQTIMVGQHKTVVKSVVFVADHDEIQVLADSYTNQTIKQLEDAGWIRTQDEPYFDAVPLKAEKKGKK